MHVLVLLGHAAALFVGVKPLVQYVYDVQVGRERGPVGFDVQRLWARAPSLKAAPEPPPTPARGGEQAMVEVCAVTGLALADAEGAVMGTGGKRSCLLAIWWLHEGTAFGTKAIARRSRGRELGPATGVARPGGALRAMERGAEGGGERGVSIKY